jgi:hypothetical protein
MIPFKSLDPSLIAPKITVCGGAGVGKTTLAALFKKPLFITAEQNSFASFDKNNMPNIIDIVQSVGEEKNSQNLWHQLHMILSEPNITTQVQTLVIDTVSHLDEMFLQDLLNKHKTTTLNNCGAYGAGFEAYRNQHARLVRLCNAINKKGIAIVYLGHDTKVTVNEQNQEPYSIYTIKTGKSEKDIENGVNLYINQDIDLVGFLKVASTSIKDKNGNTKVYGGSKIQMICGHDVTCMAKNRVNITNPIEVKKGENPILGYFPFFNKNKLNNNK